MFDVSEGGQSEDLNGDGDTEDRVVHIHDLSIGETTNLQLDADRTNVRLSQDWLVLRVEESSQGQDLNGDSDTSDWVVHVHNLSAGETTNTTALDSRRTS